MPIPAPVLYPPFNIVRLSHVVLTVTDLQASRAFYFDTLGLQVTDETSDAIYMRGMEERGHHCIVLERGDHPLAQSLSFKVFSESDLDKAREYFDYRASPAAGSNARIKAAHCAPSIRSACRSSSILTWTS